MVKKMSGKTQNLREFFRVNIKIPVYVRKIYYSKDKDRYFYKKWEKFISKDISGNGIFLYKNEKLILTDKDYALIKFDLVNNGEYIYILTKIVRATEEGYALNFILVDDNKVDRIVKEFLNLEYEKHFKKTERL